MVRRIVGPVPIGASFDMHANIAPEMATLVDVSAGYKTLPHLDMDVVAAKVLKLLAQTVEGRIRPVGATRARAASCTASTCAPATGR